jgi:acrylyl-CoA reductase (NADPH)
MFVSRRLDELSLRRWDLSGVSLLFNGFGTIDFISTGTIAALCIRLIFRSGGRGVAKRGCTEQDRAGLAKAARRFVLVREAARSTCPRKAIRWRGFLDRFGRSGRAGPPREERRSARHLHRELHRWFAAYTSINRPAEEAVEKWSTPLFRAVLIEKDERGYRADVVELPESRLPDGDVLVDVEFSTLNYKDGLAITGQGPIVRSFPMVPGIDFAGVVSSSSNPRFAAGDRVVLNGWGVGENHWGGLAQRAKVNGDWLIKLPGSMPSRRAMIIGTAGYTAMLSVMALEKYGIHPRAGNNVLVTGASGGVGSIAIMLLDKLGFRVVASTGRPDEEPYLKSLGVSEIIDRAQLLQPGKPLQKERWIAAIDSVGSHTLANVCASIKADGAVAACGMAQGLDFPSSVAPFILRGVALLGINSVTRPKGERIDAWTRLASLLTEADLERTAMEVGLKDVVATAGRLMSGQIRGRTVVDVNR